MLRAQGRPWNHKRVWRVYCALGLNLVRKARKRLPAGKREYLAQPLAPNRWWSVDFMCDTLMGGRVYRTFNALDDYNREALAVEIDTNLPAGRVDRPSGHCATRSRRRRTRSSGMHLVRLTSPAVESHAQHFAFLKHP